MFDQFNAKIMCSAPVTSGSASHVCVGCARLHWIALAQSNAPAPGSRQPRAVLKERNRKKSLCYMRFGLCAIGMSGGGQGGVSGAEGRRQGAAGRRQGRVRGVLGRRQGWIDHGSGGVRGLVTKNIRTASGCVRGASSERPENVRREHHQGVGGGQEGVKGASRMHQEGIPGVSEALGVFDKQSVIDCP